MAKKNPATNRALGRDKNRKGSNVTEEGIVRSDATPIAILRTAITAVPVVRYALGVAGVAAAVAIIKTLITDLAVALVSIVVMMSLMVLLFIIARLTAIAGKDMKVLLHVAMWFCFLLFALTGIFLFTSLFFGVPIQPRNIVGRPDIIPVPATASDPKGNGDPHNDRDNWSDLTGQVREDGNGVPGADIIELNTGVKSVSDKDGLFTLKIRKSTARLRIRASKVGYVPWEDYVDWQTGLLIFLRKEQK